MQVGTLTADGDESENCHSTRTHPSVDLGLMGTFVEQKAWADGHIDEINRVVRKLVGKIVDIVPTDLERDQRDAIDYEIRVASGDIACRIRRAERCRFRDLTMTALRPSGAIPEIQKVLEGRVRWYLYAWAQDGKFVDWMFIDLEVVKAQGLIEEALKTKKFHDSPDGSRFTYIPFEALASAGAVLDSTLVSDLSRNMSLEGTA